MLKIENLSYRYSARGNQVLQEFNMEIAEPGIYGLLGPNGAGKSTLLGLVAGLLIPDAGSVVLFGCKADKRLPKVLASVFFVPEEFTLPSTSLKTFADTRGRFYPDFSEELMYKYIEAFRLPRDLENISQLSMGQKKMVMISFALACRTPFLIMDEPTNGLDIRSKAAFRSILASVADDDRVVLISTHQVRDLDTLLDHIIIMNHRRVLLDASVADITRRMDFRHGVGPAETSRALYTAQSAMGVDAILPGDGDGATDIDLELLFGAVIDKPQTILDLWK